MLWGHDLLDRQARQAVALALLFLVKVSRRRRQSGRWQPTENDTHRQPPRLDRTMTYSRRPHDSPEQLRSSAFFCH
jgi:hypothetical protein